MASLGMLGTSQPICDGKGSSHSCNCLSAESWPLSLALNTLQPEGGPASSTSLITRESCHSDAIESAAVMAPYKSKHASSRVSIAPLLSLLRSYELELLCWHCKEILDGDKAI